MIAEFEEKPEDVLSDERESQSWEVSEESTSSEVEIDISASAESLEESVASSQTSTSGIEGVTSGDESERRILSEDHPTIYSAYDKFKKISKQTDSALQK